jgi:hypothetical protein
MRRGVAIGLAAVLLAGCGGSNGAPQDATLHVTPPSALVDVPAKIDVAGLKGGDRVVVTGTATDVRGATWTGTASARADRRGDARLAAACCWRSCTRAGPGRSPTSTRAE